MNIGLVVLHSYWFHPVVWWWEWVGERVWINHRWVPNAVCWNEDLIPSNLLKNLKLYSFMTSGSILAPILAQKSKVRNYILYVRYSKGREDGPHCIMVHSIVYLLSVSYYLLQFMGIQLWGLIHYFFWFLPDSTLQRLLEIKKNPIEKVHIEVNTNSASTSKQ